MIKAVLFDMDGVLYDSMPIHVKAYDDTLSRWGLKADPEDLYMLEGRTGHSTIDIIIKRNWGRNATQEEKETIYAQKSQRFVELNTIPKLIPDVLDVLEKVKKFDYKFQEECVKSRNLEKLEMYVIDLLLG